MTRVVPVQLVTNSFLTMLTSGGLRVGDHELPTDRTFPYSILYQIDDAPPPSGPPLTGPEEDMAIGYQLMSVGTGRKQAQWQADKLRDRILGHSLGGAFDIPFPAIAGWTVSSRLGTTPSGVAPEGSAPNVLFNVPDRYILIVTPA